MANLLYLLSADALSNLRIGLNCEDVTLQITSVLIDGNGRSRVVVSDGGTSCDAYLSKVAESTIRTKNIEDYAIIQSNRIALTPCLRSNVVVILQLNVLMNGNKVNGILGRPQKLRSVELVGLRSNSQPDGSDRIAARARATYSSPLPRWRSLNAVSPRVTFTTPVMNVREYSPQSQEVSRFVRQGDPVRRSLFQPSQSGDLFGQSQTSSQAVCKIESLSPSVNNWKIKAKVIFKSPISDTVRGDKFFVDLLDQSGQIRGTAFGFDCIRLYHQFHVGKLYYISQGTIRREDLRFNSNFNQLYCIIFNELTEIVPVACFECTDNIPDMAFNFVRLDRVLAMQPPASVDVIGLVTSVRRIKPEWTRITLVDVSKTKVLLSLWDETANLQVENNQILAVKSAKVVRFFGISLKNGPGTDIRVDPNIPDAHLLRQWYIESGWSVPVTQGHLADGSFISQVDFMDGTHWPEASYS